MSSYVQQAKDSIGGRVFQRGIGKPSTLERIVKSRAAYAVLEEGEQLAGSGRPRCGNAVERVGGSGRGSESERPIKRGPLCANPADSNYLVCRANWKQYSELGDRAVPSEA